MSAALARRLETVVVVGASLAGLRACEGLRAKGFAGRIVVVGSEPHAPYDRPPLSKQFLAGTVGADRLALASREKLDALGLEWRLGRRAVRLESDQRAVVLDDGGRLSYDGLVVATGATPRTLPGPVAPEGVVTLRDLEDAAALRARLERPGARLVVVGAGFLGLEVAATARALGAQVTVVEPAATPLARVLPAELGAVLGALHEAHGVELRTSTAVAGFAGDRALGSVRLGDGSVVPADTALVAIGVVPEVGWLEGAGLSLDDGVCCDAALLAAPGIVAAGDLARWPHPGADGSLRLEHWTNASEQGIHAAGSLLAGDAAPAYRPVPYFWSDQYGVKIQALGLPGPGDECQVVDGSLASGRFVACLGRGDELRAVVAMGRPRQLMALRPLLVRGATIAEALAVELG